MGSLGNGESEWIQQEKIQSILIIWKIIVHNSSDFMGRRNLDSWIAKRDTDETREQNDFAICAVNKLRLMQLWPVKEESFMTRVEVVLQFLAVQ